MSNIKRAKAQSQAANRAKYFDAVQQVFAAADRAGHRPQFVIVHGAGEKLKRPAWRAWNKRRPSQAQTQAAVADGYLLGVVPSSIGRVVIDIDAGDSRRLRELTGPIGYTKSYSGRGEHLWFTAADSQRNLPGRRITDGDDEWKVDVIHTHPYALVSTAESMHALAVIISGGDGGAKEFPDDLFPELLKPSTPIDAVKTLEYFRDGTVDLRRVYPGKRNLALFSVCCRGGQLGRAEWKAGRIRSEADLLVMAVQWNEMFPFPLPLAEVETIVRKAMRYLPLDSGGVGRDYYTHDSESQARRGPLAAAARVAKRKGVIEQVYVLRASGKSGREIGRELGVPRRTVDGWLKRAL